MKKNETKGQAEILKCPGCGSTSIALTKRGYSPFFGYIGANTLYHKCRNCGHKWKAGRKQGS